MPKFPKKLKKHEKVSQFKDVTLVLKWNDRKYVHMITTLHKDEMIMTQTEKKDRETGELILKPACIIDYNRFMGTIDNVFRNR